MKRRVYPDFTFCLLSYITGNCFVIICYITIGSPHGLTLFAYIIVYVNPDSSSFYLTGYSIGKTTTLNE